ncbi:MAG: hypothetical protein H6518_00555 [Microthrixaceae bacterium]|nr:hypothetical protein [Microthrixaceae bacterium]
MFELHGTADERSGTPARPVPHPGFTQDSHLLHARPAHRRELASLLDFVLSVLRAFGF